jgi:pimeloyl-ACP methyl ester carboxylesterase
MADGATIRLRRHGRAGGPRLALSHGNGFAIDGYAAFWRPLADTFDLVLFDLRNHGQNPRHRRDHHRLDRFVVDFSAIRAGIDAAFGQKPVAGLFHSVSAITAILASRQGVRWDGLVLIDPPLAPPEDHPRYAAQAKLDAVLAQWATNRPSQFDSLDAYADALARSKPFARCVPGAARAMAAATTRESAAGGRELCCPGAWEGRIYLDNLACGGFAALADLGQPALLLGADADAPGAMAPSLTVREAALKFELPYEMVNETTHMLQLERPGEVAGAALAYLRGIGAVS